MGRGRFTNEAVTEALHVFVLFAFAVTAPLLELLGRIDAFYLFLQASPASVLALVLLLSVVLPGLAVGAEWIAGLWSPRLRRALHVALVVGLVALTLLPPLKRLGNPPVWALLALAGLLGAAGAVAYARFRAARLFVTFLAPAIIVFPAVFLSSRYVSKLVFLKGDSPPVVTSVHSTTPVVLVIFDELPVVSLMDEHRGVDTALYPGFAALAERATWYRNATAVADYTLFAVPAILSGTYPSKTRLPTAADYPRNLFTLLGASHELHVFETYTYLCPEALCPETRRRLKEDARTFGQLGPLVRLYLAILLPGGLAQDLTDAARRVRGLVLPTRRAAPAAERVGGPVVPPWRRADAAARSPAQTPTRRTQAFDDLVASIAPSDRPGLYFVHVNLPHFPWEFLPSGRRYWQDGAGWRSGMTWPEDSDTVLRAYQRHLLQVAFVDRLLDRLVARLKDAGLYDRSLVVVTADHGVSFRAGDPMRDLAPTNAADILGVPLLVKAPYQERPVVSDRPVELIDVLPMIADLLGIRLPWDVDGRLPADSALPEHPGKRLPAGVAYDGHGMDEALKHKLRLFGAGEGAERLWKIGPRPQLIGRSAAEIGITTDPDVEIEIRSSDRFADLDPDGPLVPALIEGRVRSRSGLGRVLDVAVAINGTIRGVARVSPGENGEGRFSILAPEAAFRSGRNVVEAFVVEGGEGRIRLVRAGRPER